jgi:tetratricopeptide (TPR) repeat protein
MFTLENIEDLPNDIQVGIQDLYQLALNSFLAVDPRNPELWYTLGDYYKQIGMLREAEMALLESLELDPYQELAWFQLAMVYEYLGKRDDAELAWEAWGKVRSESEVMIHAIQKYSEDAIGVA